MFFNRQHKKLIAETKTEIVAETLRSKKTELATIITILDNPGQSLDSDRIGLANSLINALKYISDNEPQFEHKTTCGLVLSDSVTLRRVKNNLFFEID